MNTFANRSLPVQLSLAKLFTFRWQFTVLIILVIQIKRNDDDIFRRNTIRYQVISINTS